MLRGMRCLFVGAEELQGGPNRQDKSRFLFRHVERGMCVTAEGGGGHKDLGVIW